jgi:hypothetical protein
VVSARPLTDADLTILHAFRHALRQQARAVLGAIRSLDPADGLGTAEVRAWFAQFESVVVGHHRTVDRVVLPALIAADPASARIAPGVRWGQVGLADRLGAVGVALARIEDAQAIEPSPAAGFRHREAVARADQLVEAMDRHLDRDGAALVAAMASRLPRAVFVELQGEFLLRGDPATLAFTFPWATRFAPPAEAERLVGQLPRRLRELHRAVWVPAYVRSFPRLVAAERRVAAGRVEPAVA